MQFFQDKLLQFVRRFAFLGVDARLGEQNLGVDPGLLEQQPKAVIFRGQKLL